MVPVSGWKPLDSRGEVGEVEMEALLEAVGLLWTREIGAIGGEVPDGIDGVVLSITEDRRLSKPKDRSEKSPDRRDEVELFGERTG